MLSIFGEWMTQQIAGGMAGNLGQIQLAGHVTCSNLFMFVSPLDKCRAIHHDAV